MPSEHKENTNNDKDHYGNHIGPIRLFKPFRIIPLWCFGGLRIGSLRHKVLYSLSSNNHFYSLFKAYAEGQLQAKVLIRNVSAAITLPAINRYLLIIADFTQ